VRLFVIACFALLALALGQNTAPELQRTVDAWRAARGVSGVAAVTLSARGQQTIVSGTTQSGGATAFDAHSTVILGSTAKGLVAIGALRLVDTGRLNLDAPVAPFIPEFHTPSGLENRLTMRQLLTHQGGMPTYFAEFSGERSLEGVARTLARDPRVTEPTKSGGWYSNTGYSLAALVIERAAGQPFEQFMTEQVFKPLGLEDAGFYGSALLEPRSAPSGHLEVLGVRPVTAIFGAEYAGASSTLAMSISDVRRYLRALLEGAPLLSRASFAELTRLQALVKTQNGPFIWNAVERPYTLGWFMDTLGSVPILEHVGSTGTSSSMFLVAPSRNLAVGVILNHDRSGQGLEDLGRTLLSATLEGR
jgi:CubicO group peptidase (beta-lactamase class C family)